MLYLSRADIEGIAEGIITAYKAAFIPERRLCYRVDVLELAQMLGVRVDFQRLTPDGSVLGITTQEEACITILEDDGKPLMYYLDGFVSVRRRALVCGAQRRARIKPSARQNPKFKILPVFGTKIYWQIAIASCNSFDK